MERVNSILSLIKKTGATVGVLKHNTSFGRKFNSITCNPTHSRNTNSKNNESILWILIKNEKNFKNRLMLENSFPWEKDIHHEDKQVQKNFQKHHLQIDLKTHKHLHKSKNKNKYLSLDWITRGHGTYWKLSLMWDNEGNTDTEK